MIKAKPGSCSPPSSSWPLWPLGVLCTLQDPWVTNLIFQSSWMVSCWSASCDHSKNHRCSLALALALVGGGCLQAHCEYTQLRYSSGIPSQEHYKRAGHSMDWKLNVNADLSIGRGKVTGVPRDGNLALNAKDKVTFHATLHSVLLLRI